MSEKSPVYSEFEQKYIETERKYLPVFPEDLSDLRREARPVAQHCLSHLSEPFILGLRESINQDG